LAYLIELAYPERSEGLKEAGVLVMDRGFIWGSRSLTEGGRAMDKEQLKAWFAREVLASPDDRYKLELALAVLEDSGIASHETETGMPCCGSCGHSELSGVASRYIFWHMQADDRAFKDGKSLASTLYVSYSDAMTAVEAVQVFRAHGLRAHWGGDTGCCIKVEPPARLQAVG
jgi:hypothetical protein